MVGSVAVGAVVVLAGGALVARTVLEDQATERVQDIAVGTWKCDEHFEGELQSVYVMGITSDGRVGGAEQVPEDDQPVGTGKMPEHLGEVGTWEVDGLTVDFSLPGPYGGSYMPDLDGPGGLDPAPSGVTHTYTGNADPPSEIAIHDLLAGEDAPARWSADIGDDEAHFDEIERASGGPGVMDYDCTRLSRDEPTLVKRR